LDVKNSHRKSDHFHNEKSTTSDKQRRDRIASAQAEDRATLRSDPSAVRAPLSGQRVDGKIHRHLFFFALTMAEKKR
jgi:hypothetical protein